MRTIAESDQDSRFLLCTTYLNKRSIAILKDQVKVFMKKRDKDDLYHRFMDWQQKPNEIIVLTMYAFADIPLPIQFDRIFQYRNPDNCVDTSFTITQVVVNGIAPFPSIDHGHKHIAILEFNSNVPDIFSALNELCKGLGDQKQWLGFCNNNDYPAIKESLKQL